MEPNEVFEGSMSDLLASLEQSMGSEELTAVSTVIAVMLATGTRSFDTRMVPDMYTGDVQVRVVNGPDGQSWSVEIVNTDHLPRGTVQ